MQTVIGEYESQAAAELALQALQAQISIQSIVIGDQRARKWPRRDLTRDRTRDHEKRPNFIICMSGSLEGVEQARALLRAQTTA